MARKLNDLSCKTPCFVGPYAPNLRLQENDDSYDVVYVLRCTAQILGGPFTWYVGRCPRNKLALRMRMHSAGTACDFTAANPPLLVEALYPAERASVEAYAFFSMAETLPATALVSGRLGGWTQTRPQPSALCSLMLQEQKRMLVDQCLACGSSGHKVRDHPKHVQPDSAPLTCGGCHGTLRVTALGATLKTARPREDVAQDEPPARAPRLAAPSAAAAVPSVSSAVALRQAGGASASTAAPAPARVRSYPQVSICGYKYTTLEWYLGRGATPSERDKALKECNAHMVKLSGGNHNTLLKTGYAKAPPLRCKELWPSRSNFPSTFRDTVCQAQRKPHNFLQAKLAQGSTDLRNALLLVEDLVSCCFR